MVEDGAGIVDCGMGVVECLDGEGGGRADVCVRRGKAMADDGSEISQMVFKGDELVAEVAEVFGRVVAVGSKCGVVVADILKG